MPLTDSELHDVAIMLAIDASDYRPRRANNILEQLRAPTLPRDTLLRFIAECQEICAPHQSEVLSTTAPYRCGLNDYVASFDREDNEKYKELVEELENLEAELEALEP
jgi:hypothetical protein